MSQKFLNLYKDQIDGLVPNRSANGVHIYVRYEELTFALQIYTIRNLPII